jgi:hypothetical protein
VIKADKFCIVATSHPSRSNWAATIAIGLLSRITNWIGWPLGRDPCPYWQILSMKLSFQDAGWDWRPASDDPTSLALAYAQGAQALARGSSATTAYVEAGYKENRHNAATLARKQHILTRVSELQEEQLAIHQQATVQAAAKAQVTLESLMAEAEAARAKAMEEKGGAAAAVSALIAKAKLAGMWREKVDQHTTGTVSTVWNVSWDEEEEQSDGCEAG